MRQYIIFAIGHRDAGHTFCDQLFPDISAAVPCRGPFPLVVGLGFRFQRIADVGGDTVGIGVEDDNLLSGFEPRPHNGYFRIFRHLYHRCGGY